MPLPTNKTKSSSNNEKHTNPYEAIEDNNDRSMNEFRKQIPISSYLKQGIRGSRKRRGLGKEMEVNRNPEDPATWKPEEEEIEGENRKN